MNLTMFVVARKTNSLLNLRMELKQYNLIFLTGVAFLFVFCKNLRFFYVRKRISCTTVFRRILVYSTQLGLLFVE